MASYRSFTLLIFLEKTKMDNTFTIKLNINYLNLFRKMFHQNFKN